MNDFNKKFLIKAAECHLGADFIDETPENYIEGLDNLNEFLNSENNTKLYSFIYYIDVTGKKLKFVNELKLELTQKFVLFYKLKPCILNESNIYSDLHISSISGSPSIALYSILNNVFTPLLKEKEVQKQIANLQANLRSCILATSDKDAITVIESIEDEIEYWTNAAQSSGNRISRNASVDFIKILTPIVKDFNVIEALPLRDVEDLLENGHSILDDLWRHEPPFPQHRIIHLMDIFASALGRYILKQIKKGPLWSENYIEIEEVLTQCIGLGERWLNTCEQLTKIFWPNYSGNIWKDPPYQPQELVQTIERIQQILTIHFLHKQLVRILTNQEQENLKTKEMFEPFKDLDILEFGKASSKLWQRAEKEFELLVQPAEEKAADKLKEKLSIASSNTRQLLYECSKNSELISRPIVRQSLLFERKLLLNSLYTYVRQIQSESTSLENLDLLTKYETPQSVAQIRILKQLEAKAKEVEQTSKKLLSDFQDYDNLNQLITDLLKDLKQQQTELYESWINEISLSINSSELCLKETDPVVQFSENNLMIVNYSANLIELITEVRQFKALGYHVPSNIVQITEHAKKFMELAQNLEQIANFHNTIGDRMIPCQRPMMLNSALILSKLVQEQEVVSWADTGSVERYVKTLKDAVEKLSTENNLLTSFHYQILDKIKTLENVDLIKDYSKWLDVIKEIRKILNQVEEKNFKNLQNWKTEIDKLLCEVLEVQYIKSLDTLHLYLPEIYADIIYHNSKLQFLPDEESLKQKYQQQLTKFLEIPKLFRGVADSNEIFATIIEKTKSNLEKVDKHTEELFNQLKTVLKHWQSWIQLDTIDVNKIFILEDWNLRFSASKTFAQEIAKLPSTEERIGCFLIGLTRLRLDLELHNRNYWDQLVSLLKDSIAQDVVKLQNYVDSSTAALTRQPGNMDELGESGSLHANILKQTPEMTECFNNMIQKSKILSSWTREQIDSVNFLRGAWERLQSLLENHQHIIEKQMHIVQSTLDIESDNLTKEIERFEAKWEQINSKPHMAQIIDNSMDNLHKQLQNIKEKQVQWNELIERKNKLLVNYEKFNLKMPEFSSIENVEIGIERETNSWEIFEKFYADLEALCNEEWIVFRKKIYKFDDFISQWQSKLKNEPSNDLITRILHEIQKYEMVASTLKFVRGDDFTEKHWIDVYTLLGMPVKSLDLLIFKDFLDVSDKLIQYSKELKIICKKAASEIVVRQALFELDQWDVQAKFFLTPHTDSNNQTVMLIKDFRDILNKIGDNQSLLQSVKNSADYESFAERANLWETKLASLEQNLTNLAQIQRKWIYLEPIFGSGTIISDKSRFNKIDKDFHNILKSVEKDPRISAFYRYYNLDLTLKTLQDQLGRCQKSLDMFLQEKRDKFPRFLFLNDDDLLEVVGQSSKEQVIQTHLKKLFAGINSIELDESGKMIVAIKSLQDETVLFKTPININQPVEIWLNSLVVQMQDTLKKLLTECLNEGKNADPLKYPSQILCLSDNITFTKKIEQALNSTGLPPLLAHYRAQLNYYSSLELNLSDDKNPSSLNPIVGDDSTVLELKLKALLLDTIHHIKIIEELLQNNTVRLTDWHWQKQLRFYMDSKGDVLIKMANSIMEYSFEYLGNSSKLVRTTLTDRCFLTLTQGLHLGMGGNPYGPAGTGKTESVKALGSLLGRQVLVFNCDEGIDANSMERILSGLVRSGAWGCFDEFNRLDEATLSAVSMQIHLIQVALRTNQQKLCLLDQEIVVNRHCGIFVTLNPVGDNYEGRNKLPDNLKQLFRPVLMTQPDHEEIAVNLLHCDGFRNAEALGKKIIGIFDLAKELLSKQQHYDWGLRAIRTVLTGCGQILKKLIKNREILENTLENEMDVVARVLRLNIMSKLTFNDNEKFNSLLNDIFNISSNENFKNQQLFKALEESCKDLNLSINERQINKCLELYEQLKQRMGIAIVGPPSSGKSTIRKLLFKALTKMGKKLKSYSFNPKSIQKFELLGQIDLDTRQWTDGVLTKYSLEVSLEPPEIWSWIICDGNIDPEWIESLNSVLDDNHLLTLPSGWRIQFGPNVNFIFETHDLSYASPATVSRIGIVLLNDKDVDLDHLIDQIKNLPDTLMDMKSYFIRAVNWIFQEAEISLPSSKVGIALTGLSQIRNVKSKSHLLTIMVNSLGQQLHEDFRELFAQQLFEWFNEHPPPILLRPHYNEDRGTIDSYYTNQHLSIENFNKLIETGSVSRTLDVLSVWLSIGNEENFLLVGPHGSGKTLILENLVRKRADMEMVTIYCSANLLPSYVINKISQFCISVNTNKGKIFKPKKGHLIIYFKNLHLLKSNRWATNNLIEFLHQFITYKVFFDVNLDLVGYKNIIIIGSLETTIKLSNRFTSIVHFHNVNLPDKDDFLLIIIVYLSDVLKNCNVNLPPKAKIVKLSEVLLTIYQKIKEIFSNNPNKFYNLSPHNVTNWCSSVIYYKEILNDAKNLDNSLCEIFCYEALKQFGDRIINKSDYNKLITVLNDIFSSHYGFKNICQNFQNIFYIPLGTNITRLTTTEWSDILKKAIIQYERDGHNLNLFINEDLLHLCASISKVLWQPIQGNVFIVGRPGIGRKSAVKIVSNLQSAQLVIPNSIDNFNNDLKQALQLAGVSNNQVFVLLEDHILNNMRILSSINILICSGEIPDLFNVVELDSIASGLKDEASQENFDGNLTNFFTERVKKNLHVIACIDADNKNIWEIFDNCPAFLHNSTIIWKTEWNIRTIETLPSLLIESYDEKKENRISIEKYEYFFKIFEITKSITSAPFRFISMIQLYIDIFNEKKFSITQRQSKLNAGIEKLNEASDLVSDLRKKAAEQQEKLAEKQSKANAALDMMSNTMKNANTHKEEMQQLKSKTELENQQLMIRKKEIELELSEVEPLIKEARSAVGNIKTEALSEIRSLRAPPEIIRDILEGVLRLMGIQDTSWNSMKVFLAKRGVREEIKSFDASRITSESRQIVSRLVENKKDSFSQKSAKRASVAAAPLADWVLANVKYAQVLDKIKPLEREQRKLKENLAMAESQLGELSAGLVDVDATMAKLKSQLAAYTKEAAEIEIDLNKAQETLRTAENLIDKLSDEYRRWKTQLQELAKEIENLPNNCCLAAAYITYLSSENEETRRKILSSCMRLLKIEKFNLEEFLSNEREQLQWQTEGLPFDNQSIQNAIILLKSKVTPLLIDPTSVATSWIKKHFKNRQIDSTMQNSKKFNANLELAIRFGKMLIIEETEEINSILLPILRKEFIYQGERKLINLNGKLIDYHEDFVLILSSRNEQLKIQAELYAIIAVINFKVTEIGLTEQLLYAATRQENPKLEERRQHLLTEREQLQEKLYHLQNQLLENLANSSEDILKNSELLTTLNETKANSNSVTDALKESSEIQAKLKLEYQVYQEISSFASRLYFASNDFSKYNILYIFSISAYEKLFLQTLHTFQGIQLDSEQQKKHLFQNIYLNISRGIFKSDRLAFAFYLMHKLFPESDEEWKTFLSVINHKNEQSDIPPWIPDHLHLNIQNLQINLPDFYKNLQLNEENLWKNFMMSNNCLKDFPKHCEKINEFQRVLVVQALRPDKLYSAMAQCILNVTGLQHIDPPVYDLNQIFKESNHSESILVLTTSGSDPSNMIVKLAKTIVGNNYQEIAMGEGQETKAIEALEIAAQKGHWLILKNLHLVTKWLTILNQTLLNMKPIENFRLWLITEPNPQFNIVLAQNSRKIVFEAPQGIRNNLLQTYNNFGGQYIEQLNEVSSRIFFILSCIHAILQERRTYIPQGWSKFYEFSDADLSTCIKLMEDLWKNQRNQAQWEFIKGLCCDAVYGGRIENLYDMGILKSYFEQYLNDEMLSRRWAPFNLKVSLPYSSKFGEFISFITNLPNRDPPLYFGLPENINKAWEKSTAFQNITILKNLSIKHNNFSLNFDRDLWYKILGPYVSLWKKLNQGYEFTRQPIPEFPLKNSPLEQYWSDELIKAIQLIQIIHKNFVNLMRILKGTHLPEENDLLVGNSLINQKVPKNWNLLWPGPKDPTKYLRQIIMKTSQLSKFIQNNKNQKDPINLSNVFFPRTFFAAFKQEFSRLENIPIDRLELDTKWKTPSSRNYVVLKNLLIEGGLFDGFNLESCKPDSNNINIVPDLYVSWRDNKTLLIHEKNQIEVPLYFSSDRDEEICKIQVNSDGKDKNEWIQAGLAFYLDY